MDTFLSEDGRSITFNLHGAFDLNLAQHFRRAFRQAPLHVDRIRVDMQEVSSMDAAAFSTLLLLQRERGSYAHIELLNCSKEMARLFSLSGISRLIQVRMSLSQEAKQQNAGAGTDEGQAQEGQS